MILTNKMEEFYLIDDYLTQKSVTGDQEISGWPEIDLFSHWHRKIPYSQLSVLLERSWKKAPYDTLIMLFYLRNCHGGKGKGERRQFYHGIRWFMENHPEQILANFHLLPEFGYWKDLLNIWNSKNESLRAFIVFTFCQQLKKDLSALKNNEQISLAAKWAPTEKCADDRRWGFVGLFCEQLGWSRRAYRQNISKLRNHLGVTERLASDNRWGEMDFPEIPIKSRMILHETLQKYCGRRYQKWCQQKESPISLKAPYDIIAMLKNGDLVTANSEWTELQKSFKDFGESLCVCDVSPSMDSFRSDSESRRNQSPLNAALALTMLISSNAAEPFKNTVVSFAEAPELVNITGDTPAQKVRTLMSIKWDYSVDICAVLRLLLAKNKVPKQLFIITDRNWNDSHFPIRLEHCYTEILSEFKEHSLVPPENIYFWKIGGRWGSYSFNMDHHNKGIIIINGFSTDLFNAVTQQGQLYPWLLLKQQLHDPTYARVKLV